MTPSFFLHRIQPEQIPSDSFSSLDASDTESPSESDVASVQAEQFVGEHREGMSESEREAAAYRAGVAMQAWYSRYQQTGDKSCLDIAYRCLGAMRQILAGRAQETVSRMEQERGLSGR